MSRIQVRKVSDRSDMDHFINLPWRLYAGDTVWAPPLKKQVRSLLDTAIHPFWQFSERELFVAFRGDRPVGRIAAIVDSNYNRFHDEKMGAWGFFECENDVEAAGALFEAVENWTSEKGMTFVRGPLNPSTNYEVGLLIEGFETTPSIMMPYNPPYYLPLIESCGYQKEKDLVAILVVPSDRARARVERLAARVMRNQNLRVRTAEKKNFNAEMEIVKEIYNEAWSRNWGFVPMTEDEMTFMGKELLSIMDPDFIFFIYYEDQPAGVCLILPDITPLLKRLNGKIGLSGLLKILFYKREIKGLRGLVLGFKKQYQRLGLPLVAFNHLNHVARAKGYQYLELGWNLEDNHDINKFEIEAGGRIHRKYRMFRKDLPTPSR
jgi:hypothetical protein